MFTALYQFIDGPTWKAMQDLEIEEKHFAQSLARAGMKVTNVTIVTDFLPSPGKWAYFEMLVPCGFKRHLPTSSTPSYMSEMSDPQVAYHGCSINDLPSIIQSGLKIGVSATDNRAGIYCERRKRLDNVLAYYVPHVCHAPKYGLLSGIVLELLVDRARGCTVNRQWCQKEEESVIITGVYMHVWSIAHFRANGFAGWYQIHNSAFEKLRHYYDDSEVTSTSGE